MRIFSLAAIASLCIASFGYSDHFNIDPEKSQLMWLGKKKLTPSKHNGEISISHGTFAIEKNKIVGGEIAIDMSSIVNLDVENPKYNAKLVGHLKNDDFFSTEKYPFAYFQITKGGDKEITGNLTIRDKTLSKKIKLNIKPSGKSYMVNGTMTFDRAKFNVKYNSETFFSAKKLGDKIIDNEIKLDFKIATSPKGTRVVRIPNILKDGKKTWLPVEIKANTGEMVQLVLVNTLDAPHGFEIPGFLKPQVVEANKTMKVKFKAAKAGTFDFKCHLHPAHVGGKIIVNDHHAKI